MGEGILECLQDIRWWYKEVLTLRNTISYYNQNLEDELVVGGGGICTILVYKITPHFIKNPMCFLLGVSSHGALKIRLNLE